MKRARKIELPDDGVVPYKEYLKIKEHVRNSIIFYAVNLSKNSAEIKDAMSRKGIPVGTVLTVSKMDDSTEVHDVASEEIEALLEAGVIDDEYLCTSKAQSLSRRGLSAQSVKNKLRMKKFDPELIEKTVSEIYDEELENDSALKAASKIMRSSLFKKKSTDYEKRSVLYSKMRSLGFDSDTIQSVVREVLGSE